MPKLLCTGTMLSCSFGMAPSVFAAQGQPSLPLVLGSMPSATMTEITASNIPPFGMCQSMANPQVAAATAAALGVLTPMPCVPMVVAPWAPPSSIMSGNGIPMATVQSKCVCAYGGTIAVQSPVQGPADTQ